MCMSIASKFPSTCEISSSSSTSCLYLEWYQPQHQSATRAPCPKKTVVIVPGFWVDPTSFDEVVHGLQGRGYRATTIRLPSRGCEPPTKTLVDDARAVHDEVDKLVQEGYDVTVVMHSAGGLIAPEGLQGLQAPDLAKAGGVTGLLYITASCMSVGEEAPPALWFLFEVGSCKSSDLKLTVHASRATICGPKILGRHSSTTSQPRRPTWRRSDSSTIRRTTTTPNSPRSHGRTCRASVWNVTRMRPSRWICRAFSRQRSPAVTSRFATRGIRLS